MPAAPDKQDFANTPFVKGWGAIYCTIISIALAALAPSFADQLLSYKSSSLTVVSIGLVILVALGVLMMSVATDISDDDILVNFALPAGCTLLACALIYWAAYFISPHNGWAYLSNTMTLQSTSSAIKGSGGSLSHPDNLFLTTALASKAPSLRHAADNKIEELDMLETPTFKRLLLCLDLLDAGSTTHANRMKARGWAGQKDVEVVQDWARKHPPSDQASLLRMEAWLRLAGEKLLSNELSIPEVAVVKGGG